MVQLNSEGKLARFYLWFAQDGAQLPPDLCTYFWGLVFGAIFTLTIGSSVLLGIGYVIYWSVVGLVFLCRLAWTHKAQALLIFGFCVVMALFLWLSLRKKKIEILSEARMVIKGKIGAVKKRYCPRIEWK